MAAKTQTITRVRVAREELDKMTKEQLQKCWNLQDQYIDLLENKIHSNSEHTELLSLRESEEKLKQQQLESSRRENILVMRLTTKEHEMQEFAGQIQELKQAQVPTVTQLRSALLDPAVNLLFERMRKEVDTLKARLEETQNELSAWKFTPDSNTGKRLMAKCRLLYQENEELGKIISSGRMAKLEGDLALQKSFSEEMKKSQSELDEFLCELDEDVEGMQSTIYYLQQQLREAKEQITTLLKEKNDRPAAVTSNGLGGTNCAPANPISNNNSVAATVPDSECRSPQVRVIVENSQATAPVPMETPAPPPEAARTPDPEVQQDRTDPKATTPPDKAGGGTPEVSPRPSQEKDVPRAVAENKNSTVNHDGLESTANDSGRTNHGAAEDAAPPTAAITPNKRTTTSESTMRGGRKRTRPRTPVDQDLVKEETLPVRKRTRRREAEAARIEASEENRTPVEIDTDTEVQVAQTLASWASTKADRTDLKQVEENAVGNGELKTNAGDK